MDRIRIKRFLFHHGMALLAVSFIVLVYRCPIYSLFHIPCPGCGLTRAYMAALRFDFKAAFTYHPLFPTMIPLFLYIAHRNIMKKRLSDRAETVCAVCLSLLFIIVYIIRMILGR